MLNEKQKFEIGQVIYLISEDTEAIVPAIVIEEQVVKKLDGSSISWRVAIGPPNKRKEVDSNQLKGEMYTSLDEVRRVMNERLAAFVNNVVSDAKKKTESWYGKLVSESVIHKPSADGKIDPASFLNSFEETPTSIKTESKQDILSGTHRLKPETTNNLLVNIDPSDPKAALRKQLLDRLTPDEEDLTPEESDSEHYVIENGKKIPVKYNIKSE